jgi:hypothetical protein
MGERAVLIRRRKNRGWAVYRSQWGGTDRALATVCAGMSPSRISVSWEYDRSVRSFTEAVAGLDYLGMEVVYREQEAGTAFLALWFGLPLDAADPHHQAGAAVEVHSLQDARTLRAGFRRCKRRLAEALETGVIPASAVPFILVGGIHRLQGREVCVVWRGPGSSGDVYRVT